MTKKAKTARGETQMSEWRSENHVINHVIYRGDHMMAIAASADIAITIVNAMNNEGPGRDAQALQLMRAGKFTESK